MLDRSNNWSSRPL